MSRRRSRPTALALALTVVVLCASARAHAPGILRADTAFVVEDATISRGLFGAFETGKERFVIKLSFPEAFGFPIEVFVPHRSELKGHRPAWAIVGPGLPAPNAEELAGLPQPLPNGAGAIVDLNRIDPRPAFYEFFTRRFFWSSGVVAVVVPKGDYEIWIWSPWGTKGKFGIGFGVEEKFNFAEAFEGFDFYAY